MFKPLWSTNIYGTFMICQAKEEWHSSALRELTSQLRLEAFFQGTGDVAAPVFGTCSMQALCWALCTQYSLVLWVIPWEDSTVSLIFHMEKNWDLQELDGLSKVAQQVGTRPRTWTGVKPTLSLGWCLLIVQALPTLNFYLTAVEMQTTAAYRWKIYLISKNLE